MPKRQQIILGEDVDWWITEKPEVIPGELSKEKFLVQTLKIPSRRDEKAKPHVLEIGREVDIKELIELIYEHYQKDIPDTYTAHKVSYRETPAVKFFHLLTKMDEPQGRGSGDTGEILATDKPNRHPFMCSGLIRFEGIIKGTKNNYTLILGS